MEENDGRATIRVVRTGNTSVTSTVAYVTIGQTATPWSDFVPAMGVLVLRSGKRRSRSRPGAAGSGAGRWRLVETVSLKLCVSVPQHTARRVVSINPARHRFPVPVTLGAASRYPENVKAGLTGVRLAIEEFQI